MLRTNPGATILHNLICSRAVPETIREHGGVPMRTKVGHSFIKQVMAETGAVFGGEHSAHYYFARNYRADSGLIASMLLIDELSRTGQNLSVLRKPFERYAASGEINTQVDDPAAVIERVSAAYAECRAGPARRAHASTAGSGGSTCGRRTPSRCCVSTSRPPTATNATPTSPRCLH